MGDHGNRSNFSSSEPGTPERDWLGALADRPVLLPPDGPDRVVVVSPHPDDETLAAGGVMRALADQGWQIVVVSVTDGERAYPGQTGLAAERAAEVRIALTTLGVPATIARLGIGDGEVAAHESELVDRLGSLLRGAGLVLAPWEGDGHPDHEAVGRAVLAAAAEAGGPALWRFPVWAWHWSNPESPWFGLTRVFPLAAGVTAAKTDALTAFASQCDGRYGEAILPPWVLARFTRSVETFIV